jgi:UDP-N-acetylmuramoyl-L-alanyl-D-glutamate--2,6-diaminopimelate ligase
MRLGALLGSTSKADVTGFAIDHRKVAPGTIFGAFPGKRFNGEDYISAAIAAGAVAVVARRGVKVEGAIHVPSDEPRRTFALLAAKFFAPFPQICVAVTGTNGKTSTVELTRQLWRMAGHVAASVGTLGVTTPDETTKTGLTTPDIVTFLSNMAGLKREGVTHVAFEASSIGLDQYRTEGLPVCAAAFTNLTRDHLDYHGDMAAYQTAKLRLFSEVLDDNGTVVVWQDDEASDRVIDLAHARGLKLVGVGTRGATLKLIERVPTQLGQTLKVLFDGRELTVKLPLIGAYQAANALMAAALVYATGEPMVPTLANLDRVQGVRGRLERAAISLNGAPIYVDYAHTPDALAAAISALKPHAIGRLILVFGAGGDRDQGKRPEMGLIAEAMADRVIVTDDNPRSEDPATIRAQILVNAPEATEIGDRAEAIAHAIREAGERDIVLIAGKGHETGQEINGRFYPFDDVAVARACAS